MSNIRERLILPPMPRPRGRFVVDLLDDRGKVKQRHESDNYITPQITRRLQWWQGMEAAYRGGWLQGTDHFKSFAPNFSGAGNAMWNAWSAPHLSNEAIIATNWAAAENVNDSWLRGNTIAFANKWKASVPALGPRGQINEAENTLSADMRIARWVWDWTTQQGNGTFQTLAMGAVSNWNYGSLFCEYGVRGIVQTPPSDPVANFDPRRYIHGLVTDNDGDLWMCYPTTTSVMGFAKVAAADFETLTMDNNGVWGLSGGAAPTAVFTKSGLLTNSAAVTTTKYFLNGRGALGHDPSSDDLIYVQVANNGNWNVCRYTQAGATVYENKATGATTVTPLSPTLMIQSCAVIAGKIYAVVNPIISTTPNTSGYADVARIARFNLATGAFEAYIALPTDHYHYGVMCTDGTNILLLAPEGIRVYNTSGANIAPFNLGLPNIRAEGSSNDLDADDEFQTPSNGIGFEALISPHTTTDNAYGPQARSFDYGVARDSRNTWQPGLSLANTGSQDIGISYSKAYWRRDDAQGMPILFWYNSRLYWAATAERVGTLSPIMPDNGITFAEVSGNNVFSRTLLDSEVTKANTQNMKISYELTLPEDWLGVSPSVNPLA